MASWVKDHVAPVGDMAARDKVCLVPSWYPQSHVSSPSQLHSGGWWHSQWDSWNQNRVMMLSLMSLPACSSLQPQAGWDMARGQALLQAVQVGLCPCCSQQGEAGAVHPYVAPSTSPAAWPHHLLMKLVTQHRRKVALQDT